MSTVLEITSASQSFRTGFWLKRVSVLSEISLLVPEKSVFGFVGPNGAGKTTLIHLITGLKRPVSGTVRVFGQHATSVYAKARIGYLPERPYFYEHLTGDGLLNYFGALAGMSIGRIKERIPKVLEAVGMSHARHIELRKYSKGMLQRIGVAQAIIHDPEFLILDEPMSGLDPVGRKEMRELIVQLSSEGKTIFFSSHIIPDIEAICDQVGMIQKGRLVGYGPVEKFLSSGPVQSEIGFRLTENQKHVREILAWSEFQSTQTLMDGFKGLVHGAENVNRVLARLLAEKAQILWVTPVRSSLEDVFSSTRPGVSE